MGTSLKSNLPLAKLAFQNLKGEFFTLGSYIAWLLTKNNATHITDACASGFFISDTGESNCYAGDLKTPKAYKQVTAIGTYNGISVYTPVGDHQASFYGSEAKYDKYLLNIGTATQISCLYDTSFPYGKYERRPFFNGNTLYTLSGLVGGDKLFECADYEKFFEQVESAIKLLPKKNKILLSGGGAKKVYPYMTQRFEYETNGTWENPLKELVLIFKRRPEDANLLGKNRDRINLRTSELKDIISKDFAKTMSDEELINAILSFEQIWNTKYDRETKDNIAYEIFEVLAETAINRNLQFDFKDKKFASLYLAYNMDINEIVKNLGYDLISSRMHLLGADTVNEIYKKTQGRTYCFICLFITNGIIDNWAEGFYVKNFNLIYGKYLPEKLIFTDNNSYKTQIKKDGLYIPPQELVYPVFTNLYKFKN